MSQIKNYDGTILEVDERILPDDIELLNKIVDRWGINVRPIIKIIERKIYKGEFGKKENNMPMNNFSKIILENSNLETLSPHDLDICKHFQNSFKQYLERLDKRIFNLNNLIDNPFSSITIDKLYNYSGDIFADKILHNIINKRDLEEQYACLSEYYKFLFHDFDCEKEKTFSVQEAFQPLMNAVYDLQKKVNHVNHEQKDCEKDDTLPHITAVSPHITVNPKIASGNIIAEALKTMTDAEKKSMNKNEINF